MAQVDVLLSTYNGCAYLDEQIGSIINQSFSDWRLIVRDDGSSDATREVLKDYADRDGRIHVLSSDGRNMGPAGSFIELLKHVEAPYFMFCDQDDVWLNDKVEVTVKALTHADDVPHLVHTDLKVVNERLEPICESFMEHQRFSTTEAERFERMLMQNIIVGCTVGGNRKLLEACGLLADSPPAGVVMHDWWLGLVAKTLGHVTYIDRPTILYRQHGKNTLGAPGSNFRRYIWLLRNAKPWKKAQIYLGKVSRQAESFLLYYGARLSSHDRNCLMKVAEITKSWRVPGLVRCFASGITMHAFDRNVALLLSNLVAR
ncbi:glycosyltransferase family 2 protein [Zoogloea sp.]|uniref:glycosyltransferase family 2 protein n=1 Tax=Zoogloea sp. TaxID=49181 RepID=UPI0014166B4D|nr:MAG: glycosyltransferase family 2 protein [Zoogloea sp.]